MDISHTDTDLESSSESENSMEDGQPKKKLRKEKIGFRDRKVYVKLIVIFSLFGFPITYITEHRFKLSFISILKVYI